jgi:polysaccharide export outer membrane protein
LGPPGLLQRQGTPFSRAPGSAVHVEGFSLEEAQALIQKRLEDSGFVRNPHVTIFVDEAASHGVKLLGEVGRPGIYPDPVDRKL